MSQDTTFEAFHEAAGSALAAWGSVEEALCDLFSRLVICSVTGKGVLTAHPDAHWVMGSVFYSSTNLGTRLNLLDRLIKRLVNDDALLVESNVVLNKARRLYQRRNVLAHGQVWGNVTASLMTYSIFDDSKRKSLNYEQVCAATPSFKRYADRVTSLAIAVNQHLAARA